MLEKGSVTNFYYFCNDHTFSFVDRCYQQNMSTFSRYFSPKILVCLFYKGKFSPWGKTFCLPYTDVCFKLSAL